MLGNIIFEGDHIRANRLIAGSGVRVAHYRLDPDAIKPRCGERHCRSELKRNQDPVGHCTASDKRRIAAHMIVVDAFGRSARAGAFVDRIEPFDRVDVEENLAVAIASARFEVH
jgi:hypothetical protein